MSFPADTSEKDKPKLLFLSPIMPSTSGNGLAMRAGAFLEAYSRDYDVYLLIIPISGAAEGLLARDLEPFCTEVRHIPLSNAGTLFGRLCHHPLLIRWLGRFHPYPTEWKTITRATIRAGLRQFGHVAFDHIHVFRLYLYPFAESYANLEHNRHAAVLLDLDEVESRTRLHLARHHSDAGEAFRLRRDARYFEQLEKACLPACDQVFVCASQDRERLRAGYAIENVSVVPNTVRVRDTKLNCASHDPFSFLFVGNLNYFPNRDALSWFARQILPILRKNAPLPFQVIVVGSGTHPDVRRLAGVPEYIFNGFMPLMDTAYRNSDAVIVPLRSGGGTRIKILEAFAEGKPVVSTFVGAAGLDVTNGCELLLAENPDEFAQACIDLMQNRALRETLAARGREKVIASYSQAILLPEIRRIINRG